MSGSGVEQSAGLPDVLINSEMSRILRIFLIYGKFNLDSHTPGQVICCGDWCCFDKLHLRLLVMAVASVFFQYCYYS